MMKRNLLLVIFLLPFCLYLFGFTFVPIASGIYLSFFSPSGEIFPSLGSYKYILAHFQFRDALFNTLFIVFVGLSLELFLGLGTALFLLEKFKCRGMVRAFMLLPLGIPTIVVASNMRYLFDSNGFLNEVLYQLHIIEFPIDWLGGGISSLFAIVIADTWKVTPLVMLILLAGLENIPLEIIEAAKVDGAGYFKILRYIFLPLLKPFITMALVIRGIDAFRIFELPLALSGMSTPVLTTFSYFEYWHYGNIYTSSASVILLLLIILITMATYLFVSRQNEINL